MPNKTRFQYHPEIIERFPGIVGGIIVAKGLKNSPSSEALRTVYDAEQKTRIDEIGDMSLSEIPALSAWRSAFRQFGTNPTKYRCAAESLLRRLTKKGDIPSINTLVDIGNLISIRYALPTAIFDVKHVQGTVTVHIADGTERYRELGSNEVIHPAVGEVVFTDETGMVIARRWCWRQSAESACMADTSDAIVTIEAQHEGGRADVEKAVGEMISLLEGYTSGSCESAILDTESAKF